jgi:hypothetical protein
MVSCCSNYGRVPTSFSYDNVKCNGTETSLDNCKHLNVHDCDATEGAGVVCKTNDANTVGEAGTKKLEQGSQTCAPRTLLTNIDLSHLRKFF